MDLCVHVCDVLYVAKQFQAACLYAEEGGSDH